MKDVQDMYGYTALHHAATLGRADIAQYLLEQGAGKTECDNTDHQNQLNEITVIILFLIVDSGKPRF